MSRFNESVGRLVVAELLARVLGSTFLKTGDYQRLKARQDPRSDAALNALKRSLAQAMRAEE